MNDHTPLSAAEGETPKMVEPDGMSLSSGDTGSVTDEPKMELVKEAYYTINNVMFEWAKALDPWQGNAVKVMINQYSMVHPEHPLHTEGEDGVTIYLGTDHMGRERLLMSLQQIEYIQYYIHTMRLAEKEWVEYLTARTAALEAGLGAPTQPKQKGDGVWVPLPDSLRRRSEFVTLEPINIPSSSVMKKMMNRLHRQNKQIKTAWLKAHPEEVKTAQDAAWVDNATPGPGLRRGNERRRDNGGRRRDDGDDGVDDGSKDKTGWGGFPLPKKETTEKVAAAPTGPPPPVIDFTKQQPDSMNGKSSEEIADFASKILSEGWSDVTADASPINEKEATAEPIVTTTTSELSTDPSNFTSVYHFHAQQALILASMGGLAGVHEEQSKKEKGTEDSEDEQKGNKEAAPVGKSLFISLKITTWEEDENVVLEVGWAAAWWQKQLDEDIKEGESKYEEMRELGHYVVQDHLLSKKNVKTKPDLRSSYLFGQSLPVAEKDLENSIKQKIKDLHGKAGGGPIYMIIHSVGTNYKELDKLSLGTHSWEKRFRIPGDEYPSYANLAGIGKTHVIDTAMLFAIVENDPTDGPAPITTKLDLAGMGSFLAAEEDGFQVCGNAGNDAFYNLEALIILTCGKEPEEMRKSYRDMQSGLTVSKPSSQMIEPDTKVNIPTRGRQADENTEPLPLTPLVPDEGPGPDVIALDDAEGGSEEYDSDEGMIAGAYYVKADGTTVAIEDDDSD